jgi:hypothetical protein
MKPTLKNSPAGEPHQGPGLTPELVTLRLKRVSQLRKLCLELAKAKPVSKPNPT